MAIREILVEEAMPSFKFEGLKQGHKDQPPIQKPDGTFYNLDDPNYPVIKSSEHVFKYKYWEIPRTKMYMLKYLEEHWEYFNHSRFGGKLKPCNIKLLKDVHAGKMYHRGYWRSGAYRELKVSPNLFNAPHEGWVNRTLIHEMCHQYVTDVHGPEADRLTYKIRKGHGPLWEEAMIMAKLPPQQFDYTSNDVYRDKEEKLEKQLKEKQYSDQGLWKNYNPKTGQTAKFLLGDNLKEDTGVIVGKSTRQKDKWVIITKPSILSMKVVTGDQIFHSSTPVGNKGGGTSVITTNKDWLEVVEKIIKQGLAERIEGKGIFG